MAQEVNMVILTVNSKFDNNITGPDQVENITMDMKKNDNSS
jgi:hypothetical protein